MKSLPQQNKLQQNKKYKPKVFTNHKNAKKVNTHTHTHTHTHIYIWKSCKLLNSPKTSRAPKKKKKKKRKRKQVIKLCCRSVISIFFKLWRILASNCSSLSRLRRSSASVSLLIASKFRSSKFVPGPCFTKYLLSNSKPLKYQPNKIALYSSVS